MWRVLQRLTFLDFSRNHFELLGLPLAYAIDPSRLEAGYRKLQSHVHPDRFAAGSEAERRYAFADALRMLHNRISIFVSLPMRSLDRLQLQQRLDAVGTATAAPAGHDA